MLADIKKNGLKIYLLNISWVAYCEANNARHSPSSDESATTPGDERAVSDSHRSHVSKTLMSFPDIFSSVSRPFRIFLMIAIREDSFVASVSCVESLYIISVRTIKGFGVFLHRQY